MSSDDFAINNEAPGEAAPESPMMDGSLLASCARLDSESSHEEFLPRRVTVVKRFRSASAEPAPILPCDLTPAPSPALSQTAPLSSVVMQANPKAQTPFPRIVQGRVLPRTGPKHAVQAMPVNAPLQKNLSKVQRTALAFARPVFCSGSGSRARDTVEAPFPRPIYCSTPPPLHLPVGIQENASSVHPSGSSLAGQQALVSAEVSDRTHPTPHAFVSPAAKSRRPESADVASFATKEHSHARNWEVVYKMWSQVLLLVSALSPVLMSAEHSAHKDALHRALLARISDTTALRYLRVVLLLLDFLQESVSSLGDVTEVVLVDALYGLRADPACRVHGSNSVKALRWLVKVLQLPWNPWSSLFQVFDPNRDRQRREAVPVPPFFLLWLEQLLRNLQAPREHRILAGSFLVCLMASLRFSDASHVRWASVTVDGLFLRGMSYRTKTCRSGTPFAVGGWGLLGALPGPEKSWIRIYVSLLAEVWGELRASFGEEVIPDSLFFAWRDGEFIALSFNQALRFLRFFLSSAFSESGGPCLSAVAYTLHSCKCSMLAWAAEHGGFAEQDRLDQGHHQGQSLSLYGRDNTHGALRVQKALILAFRSGWVPGMPMSRGAQKPLPNQRWRFPAVVLEPVSLHPWFWAAMVPPAEAEELPMCDLPEPAGVPGNDSGAGSTAEHHPSSGDMQVFYESDSDVEVEDTRNTESPHPLEAEEFCFFKGPSGVLRTAVRASADSIAQWQGVPLKLACGAWLAEPILVTEPQPGARFCMRTACRRSCASCRSV